MDAKHTPGPLTANTHYADSVVILDQRGFEIFEAANMPILFGYAEKLGISHWAEKPGVAYLELSEEEQAANARRMVACWNACDGIDTDMLEGFSPRFLATRPDRALAERRALEAQRDELRRHLQAVATGWQQGNDVVGPMHAAMDYLGMPNVRPAPATVQVEQNCPGDRPECKWEPMKPSGSKCVTCGDSIPF